MNRRQTPSDSKRLNDFKFTKSIYITQTLKLVHLYTVHPPYTAAYWTNLYFGGKRGQQYIELKFTNKLHDFKKFEL